MSAVLDRVCGIGDEAAFGLEDQLRIHSELGMAGLEVRTVAGKQVDHWSKQEAEQIASAVSAAGLTVPVVDTPIGSWTGTIADDFAADRTVLTRTASHAALLGCRGLRIMSYPNDGREPGRWRAEAIRRLRELTAYAADLGVTLLHENCQGWAGQSAAHTRELLDEVEGIRLIFDVGNGLAYGYEATSFLRQVLPFVDHVHVKDGVRHTDGTVTFDRPGRGEVDVKACVRLLVQAGYPGWYSLEPHVAHIPHLGTSDEPEVLERGFRTCAEGLLQLLDAEYRSEPAHG